MQEKPQGKSMYDLAFFLLGWGKFVWYALLDPRVSIFLKLILTTALVYWISPIDASALWSWIPCCGWLSAWIDDAAVLWGLIALVARWTEPHVLKDLKAKAGLD